MFDPELLQTSKRIQLEAEDIQAESLRQRIRALAMRERAARTVADSLAMREGRAARPSAD